MGGSSQVALHLGRALQRRRHQVLLVSGAAPFGHAAATDPPVRLLRHMPALPPALPAGWASHDIAGLTEELAAILAGSGIERVHFHYAHPFIQCAEGLRRRLGADCPPLICTLHGTDIFDLPEPARVLAATALARLDAVTAVSHDLAARAARLPDAPTPIVIPNFIDLAHLPPRATHAGPARIIHVSNFRPIKQVPRLIEVFAAVAAATRATLWLVGDGPDRAATLAAIAAHGLTDRIVWWGARTDVPQLLAQADIALLTSVYESFSLFALEAMAASLPIVGFDVGGLREIVGRDGAGCLVPPTDTEALIQALISLVNDPIRRTRLGQQARQAAERYAGALIVPRYEALYQRLTARPPP